MSATRANRQRDDSGLRTPRERRKIAHMGRTIYKVLTQDQWRAAEDGEPVQAPVDISDGYVHSSTGSQLQSTLSKWFKGQESCVLAAFDAEEFERELKWEKARGGE